MLKLKFTVLFLVSYFIGFAQPTDNISLETDVKQSLQYIKQFRETKDKLNIEKLEKHTQEIISKYDLDCEQTARVYQKLGTIYYFEGTNYSKINEYFRDSTLLKWQNCDLVKPNALWSPGYFLLDFFLLKNRLDYAKIIFDVMSTTEGIQNDIDMDWVMEYYKLGGSMYAKMGDEVLSTQFFEKAIAIVNQYKLGSFYSFDLYNRYAFALSDFNKYEESEAQFTLAKQSINDPFDEVFISLNYSDVYLRQKKYSESLSILTKVNSVVDTISELRVKSMYSKQLAKSHIGLGQFDLATKALDSVLTLSKFIKNTGEISEALALKGKIEGKRGNISLMDSYFGKAIMRQIANSDTLDFFNFKSNINSMSILDYEYMILVLKHYLEAYENHFNLSKSEEDLLKMLRIIDELDGLISKERNNYNSEYSKLEQLKDAYFIYEKGIENCVKFYNTNKDEQYLQKAFELSIKNKSTILSSLQNSRKIYDEVLPDEIKTKLFQLESEKRNIESTLFNSNIDSKDSVNTKFLEHMTKINIYKQELSVKFPDIIKRDSERTQSLTYDDVIQKLQDNSRLIDIFYGSKKIYIFNLSSDGIQLESIENSPSLDKEIKQLITWTNNFHEGEEYFSISKSVYEKLYKSTFSTISKSGDQQVYISQDGILHNMPLEAFWTGDEFLVEDYIISYIYSFDQLMNPSSYSKDIISYSGFGTKYSNKLNQTVNEFRGVDNSTFANLENSEKEIHDKNLLFEGKTFLGEDSSKENFLHSAPKENGIIHTALHGIILDENTSAIIFDDRHKDVLLTSNEVYGMKLKNELTILSSCYSASGKIFEGEGARSLARSFLYAGSKNIISNLWSASDRASEKIASNFLNNVKNDKSLQDALTLAKRKYLKEALPAYRHPSYWANMVLVGVGKNSSNGWPIWAFGILGFGLLSLMYFFFKKR